MKNKLLIMVVVILIVSIVLSNYVYAFGVTPGRKTIEFKPNLQTSVDLEIVNDEHKELNLFIYTEGELNESVTLNENMITILSSENSKKISYLVNLPANMEKPGVHEAKIIVREIPKKTSNSGSFVGTSTSIISQLWVNVPYPGKYLEADLRVNEEKNSVIFVVPIKSLGNQDIVKAKAIIDILGPTNEKIATIETETEGIKAGARGELSVKWDTEKINPGMYYAVVSVTYDGSVAKTSKSFNVGSLSVDILDITVKDFKLGGIAKFNILVENSWSEDLKNVYVEMIISNSEGDEIARFKSATEDIRALTKEELVAFWDTEGVKEGSYDAIVRVYYNDKVNEKALRTIVSMNAIKAEFIGATAQAVNVQSGLMKESLTMFLVVVLIIINIAWFVYFKKKKSQT